MRALVLGTGGLAFKATRARPMFPDMLHTELCSHSAAQLQRLTGVHISTIRRWKRGLAIPEPVRRLLRVLFARDLECFSGAWRGWKVTGDGLLVSPEDWHYTPGEVRALTLLRAELARRRSAAELAALEPPAGSCLDWIDGAWTYGAVTERPLWQDVLEAARTQGPYPRVACQR